MEIQIGRMEDSTNVLVLSTEKIAELLHENPEKIMQETFQLMLMKCAEVGNHAVQEYFFPTDDNIMISHLGCREIYSARCKERLLMLSIPEYTAEDDFHRNLLAPDFMERNAEVWNGIDESMQEYESILSANLAYKTLNANKAMNQKKGLHLPEKAFLYDGKQYVYSDGMMLCFEQANENIKTENPVRKVNPETKEVMDYTAELFSICREVCTEELHLRLNFQDLKEYAKKGFYYFYDFGENKPKLPVQQLMFLLDAVPTAKLFCSADKKFHYSSLYQDGCLLYETVLFAVDCYGNEFIVIADTAEGEFELAKQSGQIATVPDYSWINPQYRQMHIKGCIPDVMFLDESCFSYISLQEVCQCVLEYAEKECIKRNLSGNFITPLNIRYPANFAPYVIFNEILKRISLNQVLRERGTKIKENGVVFAFLEQEEYEDGVPYSILNCYEYTDGRITPIAVFEKQNGAFGYRITEAEVTKL